MVQVRFLGTGEAFDHRLPNTSLVYEGGRRLLLDCGYSVPHALWATSLDPDWLDGVWLTHFHADHCFGLPAVLYRMKQDGRTRPLVVAGGPGSRAAAERVLEVGYPGILERLRYGLEWLEVPPGEARRLGPIELRCARSEHPVPNHAIRLEGGDRAVCYSGDGSPTEATRALYRGADLLIHEAYDLEPGLGSGHASVASVLRMAAELGVGEVVMVHLRRSLEAPPGVRLAHPGEVIRLG